MLLNSQAVRVCMALGVRHSVQLFPLFFRHLSAGSICMSKAVHSSVHRKNDLNTVKSDASDASQINLYCERLEHRGLIRISGVDTFKFLQGLVTNDVRLLEKFPAIYAMMLNVQVRSVIIVMLYKQCNRTNSSLSSMYRKTGHVCPIRQ